ncbi:MAG: DNA-binding CsgD family transcriptional regulator [Porticoccaceae bacterium]
MGNNNLFKYFKGAKLFLFFSICSIFNTASYGQLKEQLGNPFIKNFTEEETKSSLTVYDVSQSINGEMYFSTPGGLLEFDGTRWKNNTYEQESDLRAVLYKDDQHIYTSGHGCFGYWSKNSKGILEYTSLFFKQPKKNDALLPVFLRIKEINGKILFQTFQQIFIYDPKTNVIDSINALKGFNVLFLSKERAFIQDSENDLFEIKNKDLILIKGIESNKFHIVGVFVQNTNELLIVTKNNGTWTLKDEKLTKNEWILNSVLEKCLVNDVQEFENDKIIIGTVRNGVFIVSLEGKLLLHLKKTNGLLDNTIRKVFTDLNNNLWLGLDNGLSYVQINSNTNYLLDTEGEFGTVYASHLKDSLLYLGTNQGLFVKNIFQSKSKPKLVDNALGQIWEIEEVDNQILVGSHEGVFFIDNNKIEPLLIEGGAWIFRKHPKIDDILYVGFYSGIAVFKRINGAWKFINKWVGYGESSRFMEFDKYGHIWVAHPSKGYYRLRLSDDGMELKEYEFYGVPNKFVDTYAYLSKIDNDLVFYNPKGFFNYDPIDNTFIKDKYASEVFKDIQGINSISQYENVFWYSTSKFLGYVLRNRNKFKTIEEPFHSVINRHLNDFNKFKKFNDSTFGIGMDNGMVFHNINNIELDTYEAPPMFRYIEFISTTDTIMAPINQHEVLKVPHRNNFIKISIAMPKTPLANYKKIQYRLKGLNKDWSNWGFINELNFPGLSSGNYVLELRSGGPKEALSKTITKTFYIKPPWYLTNVAYAIYFLLLILINFIYRTYFKRKNLKQIAVLKLEEEEKRERQKEQFELEKLAADKELLLLKEENLNLEIKKKNSALASSALNNIKKNELLTDLIKDIKGIDKELLNSSLHYPVKKVIKKINNHLIDKEDWLTFQFHFSNSHAQFFQNLREKHPNLSSNEIKLSAYLKLNISSKEIASLMNIAITSVEQSRYRLRKKFNLNKDVNLVNYIQKI